LNALAILQEEFELLEGQFVLLREQLKIQAALQMFERFHAFDAIKDDKCPCCGGRVAVEQNGHGSGLKLRAVI